MADIAAIENDSAYLKAITKIWNNLVYEKMYLTGGIGASGGNEGFAGPYELPNMSAYCETCASIGDIFFNHRLFLLHGQSKYIDVLEKTLYNSMLSGVSLSADRFFYPNPLESNGQHQRQAWFGCACCPSNVARFVPAIPGYIYAVTDKDLYVNLFISNEADLTVGKNKINLIQKADFPWKGKVELTINPSSTDKFNLKIRIPGWARNEAIPGGLYKFTDVNSEPVAISVNGINTEVTHVDGYAVISRKWTAGDKVEFNFPMPVRKIVADVKVKDDREKIAFQRGPVIYCAEWPDNNTGNVLDLVLKKDASFSSEFDPSLLDGTEVIKTTGEQTKRSLDGSVEMLGEEPVKLIPYALWNNRGPGQMIIWFPTSTTASHPLPAPTIAFRSILKASKVTKELPSIKDQTEPGSSNDHSVSYYHWWPDKNKNEWIEYDFQKPEKISKTKVYWFDDGPDGGCRLPDSWEILYLKGNIWQDVKTSMPYKTTKNEWDSLVFDPVIASAIKIKVKLNKDFSAGIYEWVVN
jgi:hypothetical protein